jgi:hypothetical protein
VHAVHLVAVNYEAALAPYPGGLNADARFHQAVINEPQAAALHYRDTGRCMSLWA